MQRAAPDRGCAVWLWHIRTRARTSTAFFLALQTCLLTLILVALHHMLMLEHQIEVETRARGQVRKSPSTKGSAALVTLADRTFQGCAISLVRLCRGHGWRRPIILLATDFDSFNETVVEELERMGVMIIHTQAVFDEWLRRGVENVDIFRKLQASKFRKMELFVNPILRAYERLIYVDADGVVDANLEPLVRLPFPENVTLLMRQNDVSVRKHRLWENEMAVEMLTDRQMRLLIERYPNRLKSGGSCWFIVNVRRLHSPRRILAKSLDILCTFRAGFRLNDQTLISLLFYNEISLFPWCVWDEVPILDDPEELRRYCVRNQQLQRWLNGRLRFMYRHMGAKEKQMCIDKGGNYKKDIGGKLMADWRNILGERVVGSNETRRAHREGYREVDAEDTECVQALREWRRRVLDR